MADIWHVDWNSLVTRDERHYEAGLWDVMGALRDNRARNTRTATCQRYYAGSSGLSGVGWWQRDVRTAIHRKTGDCACRKGQPLLITGATGTLGQHSRVFALCAVCLRTCSRAPQLDIASRDSVDAALERWRPWAVINTAGFVRVDAAEHEPRQLRENVIGPTILARACARAGSNS